MNSAPIVIQLNLNWPIIAALVFGLLSFGFGYNSLITSIGHRAEGYVAFLVAGGVIITLIAIAILSWQVSLICLIAFIPSGLPMILGDILRSIHARQAAIDRIRLAIDK